MVRFRPGVATDKALKTQIHIIDASGREPDLQTIDIVTPAPEPDAALLAAVSLLVTAALARTRRNARP
jgi:hypothetical protein